MFVFESLKWSHPSVSGQQLTFFAKTALSEVVNPPDLFFGLSPRSLPDFCLWIFIVSISVYLYLCWHTSCAGSRWIVCVLFCFCTHLPRVCLYLHTFAKSWPGTSLKWSSQGQYGGSGQRLWSASPLDVAPPLPPLPSPLRPPQQSKVIHYPLMKRGKKVKDVSYIFCNFF